MRPDVEAMNEGVYVPIFIGRWQSLLFVRSLAFCLLLQIHESIAFWLYYLNKASIPKLMFWSPLADQGIGPTTRKLSKSVSLFFQRSGCTGCTGCMVLHLLYCLLCKQLLHVSHRERKPLQQSDACTFPGICMPTTERTLHRPPAIGSTVPKRLIMPAGAPPPCPAHFKWM